MPVEIRKVETKSDWKTFLNLPWSIYIHNGKRDPHWAPPLLDDHRSILNPAKNPFFKHGRLQAFLAYRDGEAVGRITAHVDDNYNQFQGERMGWFGFFECQNDPEAAQGLFQAAEAYLKTQGMKRLMGPANLTSNDEWGFLLEGYDSPARIGMTYNPSYYLNLSESNGFTKAKDILAWYMDASTVVPERMVKIMERAKKREGIEIRCLSKKNFDSDVLLIKELYNKIWEKNWGFVPMSDDEFRYQVGKLKPIIWYDMVHLALVNGKAVAFTLVAPDVNQALYKINGELFRWSDPFAALKFLYHMSKVDDCRLMAMGILPEYRGKGLDAMLYVEILKSGRIRGVKGGELSWTLEDNDSVNNGIAAMGAKIVKKYRIVEKSLE
jgi:GNAT superfamily N-acetyltransferase